MYQTIKGKTVYVVDFDTMPELPITGLTTGEKAYDVLTKHPCTGLRYDGSIAQALTSAIETGVITEPGKYGVHLVPGTLDYEIYKIIE